MRKYHFLSHFLALQCRRQRASDRRVSAQHPTTEVPIYTAPTHQVLGALVTNPRAPRISRIANPTTHCEGTPPSGGSGSVTGSPLTSGRVLFFCPATSATRSSPHEIFDRLGPAAVYDLRGRCGSLCATSYELSWLLAPGFWPGRADWRQPGADRERQSK